MAYIESHQGLRNHPKTIEAARLLGISKVQVVGHLNCLWWWALDYADDGDLSSYTPAQIASAADWEGEPEPFVAALLDCGPGDRSGFLDPELTLHDWWDYAGRLVEQRRKNAERMRAARAKQRGDDVPARAPHVQHTFAARAGATVPNQETELTEPEPTLAERSEAPERACAREIHPAPKPEPVRDELFEAIAAAWKGGPYETVRASITKAQRSLIGTAAAELRAIHADPADVPAEWAKLNARYDNPTPAGLVKHWGANGSKPATGGRARASPAERAERNDEVLNTWRPGASFADRDAENGAEGTVIDVFGRPADGGAAGRLLDRPP